ncbi:MAG: response regulator [Myxococcaceae bacterium]|nr:response regulator [Myxococcaceae bacterium]
MRPSRPTPRVRRILVVEDAPQIRQLMRLHLEREGHQVLEASDGREAIAWLERERPDLVCLDLMLPTVSGYQVCEFIQRSTALRGVPVLVVSARTQPVDRAHAEDVGASAYLIKPFTRAAFLEHVRALLPDTPAVESA